MAEEGEVPVQVGGEGEEQKTLEEDAEGKREGSPSSASSSDQEEVDAGEGKEEQGGETQATGEQQAEPQEPVEGLQTSVNLPVIETFGFAVHGIITLHWSTLEPFMQLYTTDKVTRWRKKRKNIAVLA